MAAPKKDEVKETQEVKVQEVKEVVAEATNDKKVVQATQATKRKKIDRTDEVPCRCVTDGELIYVSRRNGYMTIEWSGYGDTQYVEVGELMNMKGSQAKFLTEPWLIIEDEEVVEHLGLKRMYDEMIPIDDIEGFILTSSLEDLIKVAKKSPKGIQKLITDKSRKLVQTRELYDNRKIEALGTALNIDLNMVM